MPQFKGMTQKQKTEKTESAVTSSKRYQRHAAPAKSAWCAINVVNTLQIENPEEGELLHQNITIKYIKQKPGKLVTNPVTVKKYKRQ